MGYRSDVRITMSKNGYKKFKKYVDEHIEDYIKKYVLPETLPFEFNESFHLLNYLNVKEGIENGKEVYFGWNDIKWYQESDEGVAAIEYGLEKLDEEGYGYAFSRIGEYYDDIETRYFEGTKKDNVGYIQMPFINRSFDDKEVINRIKNVNSKEKNREMER